MKGKSSGDITGQRGTRSDRWASSWPAAPGSRVGGGMSPGGHRRQKTAFLCRPSRRSHFGPLPTCEPRWGLGYLRAVVRETQKFRHPHG